MSWLHTVFDNWKTTSPTSSPASPRSLSPSPSPSPSSIRLSQSTEEEDSSSLQNSSSSSSSSPSITSLSRLSQTTTTTTTSVWVWGNNEFHQLGFTDLSMDITQFVPIRHPDLDDALTGQLYELYEISVNQDFNTLLDPTLLFHLQAPFQNKLIIKKSLRKKQPRKKERISFIQSSFHNSAIVLSKSGELYTWGDSTYGQLGHDDDRPRSYFPRQVQRGANMNKTMESSSTLPLGPVVSIAFGEAHTVILHKNGTLSVCGKTSEGRLGLADMEVLGGCPPTIPLFTPLDMPAKVVSISVGARHSVCLTDTRLVYSWGDDSSGQLGLGPASPLSGTSTTPNLVHTLTGKYVVQVSCGYDWTVVVTENGELFAFGSNAGGRLGMEDSLGLEPKLNTPSLILSMVGMGVTYVSCGLDHTIAVCGDGTVYTWGYGANGKLGHGDEKDRRTPTKVKALEPSFLNKEQKEKEQELEQEQGRSSFVQQVSAGAYHSAVVTNNGELWVWGWNYYGQLGTGNLGSECELLPRTVPGLELKKVVQVSCGEYHTMVLVEE